MMTTTQPKVTRKRLGRRQDLFPGICEAARQFGCHRTYLYRVLKGQFPDHHGLKSRYARFVAK